MHFKERQIPRYTDLENLDTAIISIQNNFHLLHYPIKQPYTIWNLIGELILICVITVSSLGQLGVSSL